VQATIPNFALYGSYNDFPDRPECRLANLNPKSDTQLAHSQFEWWDFTRGRGSGRLIGRQPTAESTTDKLNGLVNNLRALW